MNNKTIIGVSGNKGSFSEEAANYYANKEGIKEYELIYLITVEGTLQALNDNEIQLGIFPIENSNGGIVIEAVYAMANHTFDIEKIFEIDIKHNLHAKPGTNPSSINKIASHPQALRQCRMYLQRKWPEVELVEYTDTASAAKDLMVGKLGAECAAIAPKVCSKLYGTEIIEEGIQDLKFNFTTFLTTKKK